ncbi:MAG: MarR family winged helix-turn-helix transcriptional regulator [Solirubrobacteraceae bacterium]
MAHQVLGVVHALMRGGSRQVFALMEELDLNFTCFKALHTLLEDDREISVKQVAERLGMSLPGASRTVDAMLRQGLLERREDPDDRRMKRVRVTDHGRDVARRIETARLAGAEQYLAALTPEQRERLSAALSDLPTHP